MTAVVGQVYRNANLSVATGVQTAVAFDTVANDPYGMANLLVQATRLTIPVSGTYLLQGNANWTANATGWRGVQVLRNGAQALVACFVAAALGTDTPIYQVVGVASLAAGDYLELRIYQSSGAPLNALGGAMSSLGLSACLVG